MTQGGSFLPKAKLPWKPSTWDDISRRPVPRTPRYEKIIPNPPSHADPNQFIPLLEIPHCPSLDASILQAAPDDSDVCQVGEKKRVSSSARAIPFTTSFRVVELSKRACDVVSRRVEEDFGGVQHTN